MCKKKKEKRIQYKVGETNVGLVELSNSFVLPGQTSSFPQWTTDCDHFPDGKFLPFLVLSAARLLFPLLKTSRNPHATVNQK